MARKVIEQAPIIEYYDDWDGSVLKEADTTPRKVSLNGVTYVLYLNNKHQLELAEMLEKIQKGEPTPETAGNRSKGRGAPTNRNTYGHDPKTVREWARNNTNPATGKAYAVKAGALSQDAYDAFNAAHS